MKKVGIFYVNAGGGHSGTAKALAREIEENYSDIARPILVDAMKGGPFLARWFLERGYALAVNNFPHNWKVIYWFSKLKSVMRGEDRFFTRTVRKNIIETIEQERFDIIVTVHFFLTSPVIQSLEDKKINAPVFSIVTDPFTVPLLWFINKNIKYLVFSPEAKKIAVTDGVRPENVSVVNPLVDNKFLQARNIDQKIVRQKFGFPVDNKIILVAAGGDGLYRGGDIVKNLVNLTADFKILVICGREQKFLKQSLALQKRYPNKILAVYGFANNMEELMAAADLIVSKAGPATIFESLAVGRPLILTHYIWEQEKGNCDYVVNNRFGIYEPRIKHLAETVGKFFSDGYGGSLEKIKLLSFRSGVGEIAQKILETKNLE